MKGTAESKDGHAKDSGRWGSYLQEESTPIVVLLQTDLSLQLMK